MPLQLGFRPQFKLLVWKRAFHTTVVVPRSSMDGFPVLVPEGYVHILLSRNSDGVVRKWSTDGLKLKAALVSAAREACPRTWKAHVSSLAVGMFKSNKQYYRTLGSYIVDSG